MKVKTYISVATIATLSILGSTASAMICTADASQASTGRITQQTQIESLLLPAASSQIDKKKKISPRWVKY